MENPVNPVPPTPKVKHSILIEVLDSGETKVESVSYASTEGGTDVRQPMNFGTEKKILRGVLDARQDELVAILCAQFIDNALKQKIQPVGWRSSTVGKLLTGK